MKYSREFPSSLERMAEVIREALERVKESAYIEPECLKALHLCLEEALVNAIVHGNRNDASRNVRLDVEMDEGKCTIRVHDEGEGFEPMAVPEPESCQLGGRGVCLIKHFMRHVHYDKTTRCLEMTFDGAHFAKGG